MATETREIITTATIYAIHANRTYSLTRIEVGDRLAEDLRDRGLDGTVWTGVSKPVGRQRREYVAMFYRGIDGEYVHVVTA